MPNIDASSFILGLISPSIGWALTVLGWLINFFQRKSDQRALQNNVILYIEHINGYKYKIKNIGSGIASNLSLKPQEVSRTNHEGQKISHPTFKSPTHKDFLPPQSEWVITLEPIALDTITIEYEVQNGSSTHVDLAKPAKTS